MREAGPGQGRALALCRALRLALGIAWAVLGLVAACGPDGDADRRRDTGSVTDATGPDFDLQPDGGPGGDADPGLDGGGAGGDGGGAGEDGGDGGDGGPPCVPEVCNGLDDDCDGETDEGLPGSGAACLLAGLPGETACHAGRMRCVNLPGPMTLCGPATGVLAPAAAPYHLACDVVVPAGAELLAGPGVALRTGPFALRVSGSLELDRVALSEAEGVALAVEDGGRALLRDISLILRRAEGDPLIRVRGRSEATLDGCRLHDPLGRAVGLLAADDAVVRVRDTTFAGLWVGVQARDRAAPEVDGSRFLACGTGLMADGEARPLVRSSRFAGSGFHLWLDPDALERLAPDLAGLTFEGGTPLTLSGSVDGEVRLAGSAALGSVTLLGVQVAQRGVLRLGPGLAVDSRGQTLGVAGRLEADRLVFSALAAPALRFEPGAAGRVDGCVFQGSALPPGEALLELHDAAPEVTGSSFEDEAGQAVGIAVSGRGGEAVLPVISANLLTGLWIGVALDGPRAARVEGNRFDGCGTGVAVGAAPDTLVLDNDLSGTGIHLLFSPGYFAEPLAGPEEERVARNTFDPAGTAILVTGQLASSALLQPLQGLPLALGEVRIQAGARLEARPAQGEGLVLLQGEGSMTVEGALELHDATFQHGLGTAVRFLAGSSGRLERVAILFAGLEPGVLLAVEDSSPELIGLALDGGGSGSTGLLVVGTASPEPAAPLVRGCTFRSLQIGVARRGDAEPVLEENEYLDVDLPLDDGD